MSFEIALSGINAVNGQLGTISNNIANSGTYGFKSSRANFSSMYAGSQPMGAEMGSLSQSINSNGNLLNTGRAMDAAIQGRGFFTVRDGAGAVSYTRVGIFGTNVDGNVVDSNGNKLQGYGPANGSASLGPMGDIKVPMGQIGAKASEQLRYVGNLSSDWSKPTVGEFSKDEPQSFNSSVVSTVYDSLGNKHSVSQYFVKTGTNEVEVHYSFDGEMTDTTTTLSFNDQGQLTAPEGAVDLALGTPAGATALAVKLDYAGTTQFAGDATTTANSSNGYASGTLTGVQIDESGAVLATYSNGQKQTAGTIALATFANENGLSPVSDTGWADTPASGTALYSAPGSGQAGKLSAGALEQSNVDMTGELVNLMSAQRNYQANTKVISTENELVQTLMQAL